MPMSFPAFSVTVCPLRLLPIANVSLLLQMDVLLRFDRMLLDERWPLYA
jgi:hypothetical protein